VLIGDNRRPLATVEEDVSPNKHVLSRVFLFCCESVASPQASVLCADKAANIFSVLLLICRVFFSCCGSVAWPQATA